MTDKPTVMLSKEVVFQLAKKIVEKGDVDAFNSQFMLMTRQMFEQVEQAKEDERREILELIDDMSHEIGFGLATLSEVRSRIEKRGEK